jgi:hypothetical protein
MVPRALSAMHPFNEALCVQYSDDFWSYIFVVCVGNAVVDVSLQFVLTLSSLCISLTHEWFSGYKNLGNELNCYRACAVLN